VILPFNLLYIVHETLKVVKTLTQFLWKPANHHVSDTGILKPSIFYKFFGDGPTNTRLFSQLLFFSTTKMAANKGHSHDHHDHSNCNHDHGNGHGAVAKEQLDKVNAKQQETDRLAKVLLLFITFRIADTKAAYKDTC
jgi:hypothetical protein